MTDMQLMLANTYLLGFDEAVEEIRADPNVALLSIRNHGLTPLELQVNGPRLDLAFDDLSTWDGSAHPPRAQHAQQIVKFGEQLVLNPYPQGLIVHCDAGISRSSAALLGLAAVFTDCVRRSVQTLFDTAHRTMMAGKREFPPHPNARLVGLLDIALNFDGMLLDEVLVRFPRLIVVSKARFRNVLDDALRQP